MNIDDYYFVKCERVEEEKFSELEKMLKGVKGVEVQYSFPYIATVAARIEDKKLVEELVQKGYIVEKQQILRKLDAKQP
ncbi:MAG: hypothetical protein V1702_02970 [Candidatus Woesearchaeota archaeon]